MTTRSALPVLRSVLQVLRSCAVLVAAAGCVQAAPINVVQAGDTTSEPSDDAAADVAAATPTVAVAGDHGVVVGATLALTAATSDGQDSAYTWATLDSSVASVDAAGLVTGVAAGETTVTATGVDTGAVGRHAIVVVATPAELPAVVTVSGAAYGLALGATAQLAASTGQGVDTGYTWASADPTVASVDAAGLVSALVVGETTVTATGKDTGAVGYYPIVVWSTVAAPTGPVVPYAAVWAGSAHADKTAEPFNHWNADDPPQVPVDCARCHSSAGYRDYLGDDGTPAGVVDAPAPVGSVVDCQTCHNAATANLTSVTFPSGAVVDDLGPEARCMTCHQGRASTNTVDDAIAAAGAATDDTPSDKLSFLNIHYYAAGATLYAGRARGGYQYSGQVYDHRFRHVEGLDTCVGCHDPHSLKVRTDRCVTCHKGVGTAEDTRFIRMLDSQAQDYDGDGNTTEGIHYELVGLRERLLAAIQKYTSSQGFGALCYSGDVYPYWFKDGDGDHACGATEAAFANRYATWTPRLVRAAYNYQVSLKDPGAFAHNAKYIIQLLYDSVADLAKAPGVTDVLGDSVRNDVGHFNGASEAARHWDADEEVSASCSRCHGGSTGLRFYLKYGVGTTVAEPDNGLECSTCHDNPGTSYAIPNVPAVTFPSGITIPSADTTTNLCSTCHTGREARSTIDAAIASNKLSFKNVHYLPAAAVRQGSAAKVGYEYDGKTYAGPFIGHMGGDGCTSCHAAVATKHTFRVSDNLAACGVCHKGLTNVEGVRSATKHAVDYDGDGDAAEPLAGEVAGLREAVLAAMQAVVAAGGSGICYDAGAYPYFFVDTNKSGVCEEGERVSANGFKAWTPALMKAGHNFQIATKDPGAWAHNFDYVGQLLFDSVVDLGGDTSLLSRP